jgi:cytidyltransferase-like protein
MRPIGIFGGTFDPIHYGHLRTALELQQTLDFERVHFVPCENPPHQKKPISDGALRMRLVEAAIEREPQFVAAARELERQGPSYTIDTLASFRKEFPQQPLCLLVGMDAFLGLPAGTAGTSCSPSRTSLSRPGLDGARPTAVSSAISCAQGARKTRLRCMRTRPGACTCSRSRSSRSRRRTSVH